MATEPTVVDGSFFNFFLRSGNGNFQNTISSRIPIVDFESYIYNVQHRNRGIALIFNHEVFDSKEMKRREGTQKDEKDLTRILQQMDFDVRVYNDLKYGQLHEVLQGVSSSDHSHNDCLVVVVMSHGEDGLIHARDHTYPPDLLWEPFIGSKCVSLTGKPKLFFLQACRGDNVDEGALVRSRTATDAGRMTDQGIYRVPAMADILVMYSTYQGYFSWRSPDRGSWFIQALCAEFEENGSKLDLLTLLTFVNRRVALHYQSNVPGSPTMDKRKQVCTLVSMLTRIMFFPPKKFEEIEQEVDNQVQGDSKQEKQEEVVKVTAKIADI